MVKEFILLIKENLLKCLKIELAVLNINYPYLSFSYDELTEPNCLTRQLIERTFEGNFVNNSATSVGAYAFRRNNTNVPKLTEVTLPNVTVLYGSAFDYGYCITKIDLPSVTELNNYSLREGSLETLILRSNTLVKCIGSPLVNTPIANGTGYIYVPRTLVDAYKKENDWSKYANQFRAIEDYPEICGGDN